MHLLIVTPIFPPAGGGAATYYELLSRALLAAGYIERITIITEQYPGEPPHGEDCGGERRVIRLFPNRAGGAFGVLRQGTRYARQNVQYRRIAPLVAAGGVDAVLVHSSFHNLPNLLGISIGRLPPPVSRIADVRDHQMPVAKLARLEIYDKIIACSENVAAHLARRPSLVGRVAVIPIPHETVQVADTPDNHQIVAAIGLEPGRYFLFAGLIKRRKGIELLLDTYRAYRAVEPAAPPLALAGLIKDPGLARRAADLRGVRVLGEVERRRLLVLMKFAALNVNLSSSEGMPRVCLEALALGTRVILPRGIPEFQRYCPASVAATADNAETLARQFRSMLALPPESSYPMEQHTIACVLPRYRDLIDHARLRHLR